MTSCSLLWLFTLIITLVLFIFTQIPLLTSIFWLLSFLASSAVLSAISSESSASVASHLTNSIVPHLDAYQPLPQNYHCYWSIIFHNLCFLFSSLNSINIKWMHRFVKPLLKHRYWYLCVQRTYAEDVHCFAISKFFDGEPYSCAPSYYKSQRENQTGSFCDRTAMTELIMLWNLCHKLFISVCHIEIMANCWSYITFGCCIDLVYWNKIYLAYLRIYVWQIFAQQHFLL